MTPHVLLYAILCRALFGVGGIVGVVAVAAYLRAIALRAPPLSPSGLSRCASHRFALQSIIAKENPK